MTSDKSELKVKMHYIQLQLKKLAFNR